MNNLSLNLNQDSLLELMRDFNILTGIKIVIFDANYHEILSYPNTNCAFCKLMNSNDISKEKCKESNEMSFKHCNKTKNIFIYHCHANLIEATVPLIDNDVVIGYVMFGQITDENNKSNLIKQINSKLKEYNIEHNNEDIYKIKYKNNDQILAAGKILEACALYVLLNEFVSIQKNSFINRLNQFINEHISEDLSIERLMNHFHLSKNKLYDLANKHLGMGIAEYIKNKRIELAKDLLVTTDDKVIEISDKVGFYDYNYFCRVFKHQVGISAKQYRKKNKFNQ